ncbi:MAG TPA: lysozyme [Candidatus Sulfotelmatobacter sp.]|jgi:lysozyme
MTFIPHSAHPGIPSARGGWFVKPHNPHQKPPADIDEDDWLVQCEPLTQCFEGCYLTAYPDPCSPMANALVGAGIWYDVLAGAPIPAQYASLDPDPWSCGWGQTGDDVSEGTEWTQDYADMRLGYTLEDCGDDVDRLVIVPLTAYQKAALADFIYNEGVGNFESSTLLALLNQADYAGAADEFPKWNLAGGEVNSWLVKRRACEQELFLTGTWTQPD